jgi:hypothetical protein
MALALVVGSDDISSDRYTGRISRMTPLAGLIAVAPMMA